MSDDKSNSRVRAPKSDQEIEAQVALDQIRYQAGGALTGKEVRDRWGEDAEGGYEDPPLDWRLTPKNILLQLMVLPIFIAVVYFLISLFLGGWTAVLGK